MSVNAPLLTLFVPGAPQPAGSKRAIPLKASGVYLRRPSGAPIVNVVDDAKGSRAWKERVAYFAREAWRWAPLDEPVALTLVFTLARPRAHFGSRGGVEYLKSSAPSLHTKKPDALKLARGVEDALTGIVWRDDSLIAEEHLRKCYGESAGVAIVVRRATDARITEHAAATRTA